jgi:NAD+ kinase
MITNTSNYINPDILEITIDNKKIYAINEVVIQALNTVEMNIKINDIFYEKFKGTGILVCTKTGSTGQAKTNNGAIIAPNINAIQLIELAPTLHANKITITSPLILDGKSKIELLNFKFNQRTDVIADGMLKSHLKPTNEIKIRKISASFELFFSLKMDEYIKKLHKTFISLL